MGRYILKRFLWLIPVVIGVVFIVFTILRLSPNDPIRTILGDMATQEEVDAMREEVGLNDPFFKQFFDYIKGIVTRFDFGESWVNGKSVVDEIKDRFPITLQLAVFSTLLAACLGIPGCCLRLQAVQPAGYAVQRVRADLPGHAGVLVRADAYH